MTAAPPATPGLTTAGGGIPGLVLERARTTPGSVALRRKSYGRWEPTTWQELAERVARLAAGLRAVGVAPGDRVAVLADNRPEWVVADLATQALGAISVGLDPALEPAELQVVLAHAGAAAVVAEDEEQYDKLVEIRAALPDLRTIVVVDPRGIALDPADAGVRTLADVDAAGADASVESLAAAVAATTDDQVATLVYERGGPTGLRAAQLTHANLRAAAAVTGAELGIDASTEVLSYLPLALLAERIVSLGAAVEAGAVVCFGAGGDSFLTDLNQVQPTFLLGIPMVFEQIHESVERRMLDASWLKRRTYHWAMARGRRIGAARREGRLGLGGKVVHAVAWLVLYRPLRIKLGLLRVRDALCVPAPADPAVLELFWAAGVPVRTGYGVPSGSGLGTVNPVGGVRLDTVGRAVPGTEVRIGDAGEICTRGPGTFAGWFGPGAGSPVDAEGWVHTDDTGALDADGYLHLDAAEAPT